MTFRIDFETTFEKSKKITENGTFTPLPEIYRKWHYYPPPLITSNYTPPLPPRISSAIELLYAEAGNFEEIGTYGLFQKIS